MAGWDDGSHWAHQTTCEGKVAFKSASLLVIYIYAIWCDTVIYIWCDISCNVNLILCSSTASALRLFWLIIPFLGRTRKVEKSWENIAKYWGQLDPRVDRSQSLFYIRATGISQTSPRFGPTGVKIFSRASKAELCSMFVYTRYSLARSNKDL